MDKFEKFGIVKQSGYGNDQRTVFSIMTEEGNKKILRTRQEVVKFLSKNPEIDIPVEDFVFKSVFKEILGESKQNVANDSERNNSPVEDLKRKNVDKEDQSNFEAKVARVMEKPLVNSDQAFQNILPKLHEIRQKHANSSLALSAVSVTELKQILTNTEIDNDPIQIVKALCKNEEIFLALQSMFFSTVEAEMDLNSLKDSNPVTMKFPPSNSQNFYCDVIEEAILKMPKLLSFVVSIVDSGEKYLTSNFAIKIANLLCEILSNKDKRHSALKKINTLHLLFQNSAVASLKIFQLKGNCCSYTEGSRMVEEIAELAEFYKNSKYNLEYGCQLTMDNVDVMMKNKLEHWILVYSRQDPLMTKDYSSLKPNFDLQKVDHKIVFLKESELDYLKKCTHNVLVKKLSTLGSGFASVLKSLPVNPVHKHSEMFDQQEIFIESLEPLDEMENQGNSCLLNEANLL